MSARNPPPAAERPPFAADAYDLGGCRLTRLAAGDPAVPELAAMLAASQPWQSLGLGAAALAAYLARADPGLGRFRIRIAGKDQGILCLRYPWLRGAYIELIGIAVAARGKGAGAAVIAWMAAEIAGHAANLWATVSASNEPARAFYRRQGFLEIAPLADLVRPGADEILLRKRL